MYCWNFFPHLLFINATAISIFCYLFVLYSPITLLCLLHISSHVLYCSLRLTFNPLHFIFDHLLLCFNPTHLLLQLPTFVFTHFLCWLLIGCYFIFKATFIVLYVLLITFAYSHSLFANLCPLYSSILFSLYRNYDWDGF